MHNDTSVIQIPNNWSLATIEELCDLNPKHDRQTPDDLMVSFVPMAAVSDELGRIVDAQVRPFSEVKKGFTHFADGDVLFAKITPCMENGKAASVRQLENGIGCGTTEFYVFRQRGALNQDFLFYFVRQEAYRKAARAQMQSGVGQARVPKEFVQNTEIPVPPLGEQTRIVTAIESLQQRSARARTLLSDVRPKLDNLRQSILQAAFSGRLTADWRAKNPDVEPADVLLDRIRTERRQRWEAAELAKYEAKGKKPPKNWQDKYKEPELVDDSELPELPEGWCWARFEELISELRNGLSPRPNDSLPGVPILRINSVRSMAVDLEEIRYLDNAEDKLPIYRLEDGDLLFTRYNGSLDLLGVCGMVRGLGEANLLYPDKLMRARFGDELTKAELIELYFTSPFARSRVTRIAKTTSGQQGISGTDLKDIPVPVMPIDEQAALVRVLRKAVRNLLDTEAVAKEANSLLQTLDQSILSKAFRGELVPQDPNDEPASELLARIRAKEDAAVKKATKKKVGSKQKARKRAVNKQ